MSQQGDQLSIHFSLAKNNSFASGLDLPYCLIYVDCKEGKRHEYPNVHRSTVYNSQDMEAT